MDTKIVYVAGPYRGANAWVVENNIRRAEELGFEVAEIGAMPLIPHSNTRYFNGTLSDDLWIVGTLELLRRCDAAIFVPGWEASTGSRGERAECDRLRIPAFDRIDELKKWVHRTRQAALISDAHELLLEHCSNMLPNQQRAVRAAYEEWQAMRRRFEAGDNGLEASAV